MRALSVVSLLVASLCLASSPSPARAGGFEYPGAGTRALGRGGAFYARADDPMALHYNPANLASLSPSQLMLNVHLGWFGSCYRRAGFYEPNLGGTIFDEDPTSPGLWAGGEFPEVCNEGPPGPSPDLAYTMRLGSQLGLGFGLIAPAAIGHNVYADDVDPGTIRSNGALLPAPGRYVLLEEQLIIAHPTVGIGYRPLRWLQVGASFQWGLGIFKFVNTTRPVVGTNPEQDVRSDLSASDFFVPAAIVSVHAIPHDNLDVVLSFRWSDDVRASGDTTLRYGAYGVGDVDRGVEAPVPTDTEISDTRLEAPQPWSLALGVRYADRITPRPEDTAAVERLSGRVEDPMSNERWDVELDVVWEMNSRVDDFVVDLPDDAALSQRDVVTGGGGLVLEPGNLPLPDELRIRHDWKDQLSIRLGGDYNVIPGMASLRLGGSFETNGVTPSFANLDFIPSQRIGVHGGLTVRLGRFDISLAYAHFFQETIEVPECATDDVEACAAEGAAALEQISADEDGRIVNAGTYESNIDVISLGVTWHI